MDPSPIRPIFWFSDQPRSNRIGLHVCPLFRVIFPVSQIAIEIFRLPKRSVQPLPLQQQPCAYRLPHLYPLFHGVRGTRGPRKKVYVVRHQQIIPNPPSISLRRTLPHAAENLMGIGVGKYRPPPGSHHREEHNGLGSEGRQMSQVLVRRFGHVDIERTLDSGVKKFQKPRSRDEGVPAPFHPPRLWSPHDLVAVLPETCQPPSSARRSSSDCTVRPMSRSSPSEIR